MGASDKKSEQTYLWLRSYIDENKFANNSKLPSENVIRHRLSVSRETARTALARLAEEGLIRKNPDEPPSADIAFHWQTYYPSEKYADPPHPSTGRSVSLRLKRNSHRYPALAAPALL